MTPSPSLPRHRLGAYIFYGLGIVVVAALAWSVVLVAGRDRGSAPPGPPPPSYAHQFPEPPAAATLLPTFPLATDADLLDGVWFILDRPSSRVHRLSVEGEYLGGFAGEGDGPGEFRHGGRLVTHGDTIVVAAARGLFFFGPDGTSLGWREAEEPDDCRLPHLADLASTAAGLLLAYACSNLDGEDRLTAVAVLETGPDRWRRLAERRVPSMPDRLLDPLADMIVLAEHPRGFLFGHPADECLRVLDLGGREVEELCHRWIERLPARPLGAEGRETILMARAAGFSLEFPERYLPFDRVFMDPAAGPVYRAPTLEAIDLYRFVARDSGPPDDLPPASDLFMSDGVVLAVWQSLSGSYARSSPWTESGRRSGGDSSVLDPGAG